MKSLRELMTWISQKWNSLLDGFWGSERYFKKFVEESENQKNLKNVDKDITGLHFVMDSKGDYQIELNWNDKNELVAEKIGNLLAGIHYGVFKKQLLALVVDICNEPENQEFGDSIIKHWMDYENKYSLAKSMLSQMTEVRNNTIKPSEVFRQLKGR